MPTSHAHKRCTKLLQLNRTGRVLDYYVVFLPSTDGIPRPEGRGKGLAQQLETSTATMTNMPLSFYNPEKLKGIAAPSSYIQNMILFFSTYIQCHPILHTSTNLFPLTSAQSPAQHDLVRTPRSNHLPIPRTAPRQSLSCAQTPQTQRAIDRYPGRRPSHADGRDDPGHRYEKEVFQHEYGGRLRRA